MFCASCLQRTMPIWLACTICNISFRMLSGIITRSPLNKILLTLQISSCASKSTRTSGSSCARCSGHDVRTTWASFCSDWSRLVSSTSCVCHFGVNADMLLTSVAYTSYGELSMSSLYVSGKNARLNASATGMSFPDLLISLNV